MNRLSLTKIRSLFILFFLALVIPSGLLSFKAYQQLRWQTLHQYQQDANSLVARIDNLLSDAIAKEEARADTDYTFFVLEGAPQARFVQRSELSKYPVESDLKGILGYFQVDEKGEFSSPMLPSEHVQSAVHPQLYGISVDENKLRRELVDSVRQILSQNKLVVGQKQKLIITGNRVSQSSLTDKDSDEYSENDLFSVEERLSSNSEPQLAEESRSSVQNQQGFSQLNDPEIKREKGIILESRDSDRQKQTHSEKKILLERTQPLVEKKPIRKKASNKSKMMLSKSRQNRVEKKYSPQQSFVKADHLSGLQQQPIQINLFESEIEPFKFSLLQSGHFVIYRQVWRNKRRIIQGAVISKAEFINEMLKRAFEQSSLSRICQLNIFYNDKLLEAIEPSDNAAKTKSISLTNNKDTSIEILSQNSLSEPFGQLLLDFRIVQIPQRIGGSFILMLTLSLLSILVLGCYFLYRLTIKQMSLAQRQQDFVSSVSHELKTPLTSIRMYGEILKQGWVSEEKRIEYYDYIYTESERLSRLIANVLQISKVNHNALELNIQAVEVSELISLLHSKIDSQIEQSDFVLRMDIAQELDGRCILVDSDAFVQIMINLVDNAIKYANDAVKKQIEISVSLSSSSEVRISVRDFGPGIDKVHLKHIFELFYRSGNELTRDNAGTGIGLALVKELVVAMGAKIEVCNRHPGAEFIVKFSN